MTVRITSMTDAEASRAASADDEAGLGALRTARGNLPLDRIDVRVEITGLTSRVELTQDFVNTFDVPLEATYVFPLPDRGAVTRMQMTADGRTVEAELREREAARQAYDDAIVSGRRASIAEEERPDVFTMRVGNILPGERVSVALTLVSPLAYEDGEATFRLPLVVAPRYIPGDSLAVIAVGDGYADDTDAVPDASRITPPVLLPGFPHPVPLSIDVSIDPAGLALSEVRSSLHAVSTDDGRIRVQPGERANRDFILRLRYGADDLTDSLVLVPDAEGDEGTYQLTVLPPVSSAPARPRDLVLLVDRSGSMGGWKMVAARRAAARIVDTLTSGDRFAVLTFDDQTDRPAGLSDGLVGASDRNRYRAVEHLARVDARGGTELLGPLRKALTLLRGPHNGDIRDRADARDAVVILVTDGQVGNEDQLLRELSSDLKRVRVHTVGIDQAVNAGFPGRLANVGGGSFELVESEDRLDEAMHAIHRRIGAPLAYSLALRAGGLETIEDSASPVRIPDLFPGVPLVVSGRYRGSATGSLALRGTTREGGEWSVSVDGQCREAPAVTAQWARAHLRDLEDRYASADTEDLEQRIVDTSLRFGVLCRFTAYVAVDSRKVVDGGVQHRVMQPVELPAGWEQFRTRDHADILCAAVPLSQPLTAAGLTLPDEPIASAPVGVAAAMPSQPVPPAKASAARTVKLRNVIAVFLVGVLLLGGGWAWSLGREGASSPTSDGIVTGKIPASGDTGATRETRGGVPESTVAAPEAPPPPQAPQDNSTFKRDIVTTGSVQMVVAEPTQVADRLVSAVTDAGGRVDSRSERSGSSSPTVDLVVRIPADKLDGVLADAKKLGTVESMSIRHTDVTSQRVDLDARVEALQTSVNRLLQLMGRAGNVADLLAAESSLTQRQAELDSLRAQRAALGDQISYATIDVNLAAKPTVTHGGFLGALERGWHSLLSAVHGVVIAVGFLIPWLPVLAVLALVVVLVVRRKPFRRPASADASSALD
jgi:Mg-chelatase subunit ChlD